MQATSTTTSIDSTLEEAWITLLSAARYVRDEPDPVAGPYGLDGNGRLVVRPESRRDHSLSWNPDYGWTASPAATGIVRDLFDLYLPLCNVRATAPITIGHLGQSLDGYIATRSGDSFYVTGPQNIRHLHRMRALCDAVVVGAKTVAADNPRLTTRLVSGDNPIRVVMDPHARLSCSHAVFTDATTRTLLVRDEKADAARQCSIGAEVIRLPLRDKKFDLTALLSTLRQRGLYSVFVEGGGTTVSRFLECGLLERLQIAVAPLVIGSGRPGVRLEGDIALKNCLRPMSRLYRMGRDMLFDLELAHSSGERTSDEDFERVL